MTEELLRIAGELATVAKHEADLIDRLFVILCKYDSLEGLESLFDEIKECAERNEQWKL